MIDIFLMDDVRKLLKKKTVVFMGDSNVRAMYKDVLCLLHQSKFIPQKNLKQKMEDTVFNDRLVFHGQRSNGREYREERKANIESARLSFYFLTRIYDDYVRKILQSFTVHDKPDCIVVNSCLWDITRWGPTGVDDYKANLNLLMSEMKRLLPDCLVIWMTTPPIACEMKGGFLLKELQFLKYSLRFHVVEANHYARKIVVKNGFDVLDTHYHLKMQLHRRSDDGIHWYPQAVRYITNLLLTHISLAWNVTLPHRYDSSVLVENVNMLTDDESTVVAPVKAQKREAESTVVAPVQARKREAESTVVAPTSSKRKVITYEATEARAPSALQAEHSQQRKEKENYHAQNKSESHAKRKELPRYQPTMNTYQKRIGRNKRRVKRKRWQKSSNSSHQFPHEPSASRVLYDAQHDSGYLPSPNPTLSNDSFQANNLRSVHYQPPFLEPSQVQLDQIPLPHEPYRFGQSTYTPQTSTYGIHAGNSAQPYEFPHVEVGQTLYPKLDFTSNDFSARTGYF